jgi:hypothetical protein
MRIHARAVTPARLTQRKETCHAGTRNAEEDHRDGHQLGAPEKDQLGRLLRPRKLLTYRFRDERPAFECQHLRRRGGWRHHPMLLN